MDIVFLGPPGAGKGTQAKRLSDEVRLAHLSTGAMLRRAVTDGTPVGIKAKDIMERGELVSDEVLADLVREALGHEFVRKGVILDGYPRNATQAVTLDEILTDLGRKVDCAVLVDLQPETIVERLSGRRSCPKCGTTYHVKADPPKTEGRCDGCDGELVQREDDRPETVTERLRVYREQTAGIESRYEESGVLRRIDGSQGGPDDVFAAVLAAVREIDSDLDGYSDETEGEA
ncbi:MAG: adenylate kinase [Planctomycetota bacterium]|jgi:adenylate kinase